MSAQTPEERPVQNWDKHVSAAYLRMLGNTQEVAGKAVGVDERTIRRWESDPEMWERARAEARARWLNDAADAARTAVLNSLKMGNADLGKWMLERVETALAPPKQKHELAGEGGGPLVVEILNPRKP